MLATVPEFVRFRYLLAWAALAVLLCVLPFFLSYSQKEILVFTTINVILVVSYRHLTLTGEWSLGHVVMMGCGAYGSALASKQLGLAVPLSMLLGGVCAALVGWLLSYPLFRMKGFYFLIGSFAAGEVIRLLWKRFRDPFGGPKGLKRVPGLEEFEFAGLRIDFFDPVPYYFFSLAVAIVCIWLLWRIERSPLGWSYHAVHWGDDLARSVGIPTRGLRRSAMVTASFFAGISGALLVHYVGAVNPSRFNVEEMVYVLTWAIVGGVATLYGPILGVVSLTIVNEIILREFGLDQWRPLFYGALLIVSVLFLPKGLESLVVPARSMLSRLWTRSA